MSDAMKQAEALLTIALDTYAEEITPALPSGQRYAGAMVASALGIAQHHLSSPDPGDALVESLGATEGTVAAGTAEIIVDITSTGTTLKANHLKILDDGLILKSQAVLAKSKTVPWSNDASRIMDEIVLRLEKCIA